MATLNENPEVLSNFDRLRSNLKKDSLALALLEAWTGRVSEDNGARAMLDVLNNFDNSKQGDNDQTISEEN